MKTLKSISAVVAAATAVVFAGCEAPADKTLHTVPCDTYAQVDEYFAYRPGCGMIISGHRGGVDTGYPENCIESFEHTLQGMPSFFEIDPRMTKDGVIVLMHDSTLERTTTGEGLVKDYTWDELSQLSLVDREGNITPYKIPLVEDVILWSKGKTVINFDLKDVSRDILIPLVNKCEAQNVIYTVHNPTAALQCLSIDPEARFSIWVKNMDEFRAYDEAGVPWSSVKIAYVVSNTMKAEAQELYDALHSVGVRCMTSTAPFQDHIPNRDLRRARFAKEVAKHPDIIETDYPLDFVGLYENETL